MRSLATKPFLNEYSKLPVKVQRRVDKALLLLLSNYKHPSLRTKKMQGRKEYFEARVSRDYRIIFRIEADIYLLLHIGPHNILRKTRT